MRPNAATLAVVMAVAALALALTVAKLAPPSVEERWARLGLPEPRVEFIGDFTDAERAVYVRELKDAQAFYAERFGAVASDFTTYFGDDFGELNAIFQRLHGDDRSIPFDCGGIAPARTLFIILEGCADILREQGGPIAHEYFHIVQQELLGLDLIADDGVVPLWLAEGSAVYVSTLLAEARYPGVLATLRDGARSEWSALGKPLPRAFNDAADPTDEDAGIVAYRVGLLAVEWLVERTSPSALMDYFRRGGRQRDFEAAFGISWDAFHAAFEAHRVAVASPYEWRIAGMVRGSDDEPLEGVQVMAVARPPGEVPLPAGTALTDADGRFAFRGPGRLFTLTLLLICPGGDGQPVSWSYIGEWGADGLVASADGRTPPAVGARPFAGQPQDRTDIIITLPEASQALAERHCRAR